MRLELRKQKFDSSNKTGVTDGTYFFRVHNVSLLLKYEQTNPTSTFALRHQTISLRYVSTEAAIVNILKNY